MAYCRTFKSHVSIFPIGPKRIVFCFSIRTASVPTILSSFLWTLRIILLIHWFRFHGPNWCPAKSNRDVSILRQQRSAPLRLQWASLILILCLTILWKSASKLLPIGMFTRMLFAHIIILKTIFCNDQTVCTSK